MDQIIRLLLNIVLPVAFVIVFVISLLQIKDNGYMLLVISTVLSLCIVYSIRRSIVYLDLLLILILLCESVDFLFQRSYDLSLLHGSIYGLFVYFIFRYFGDKKRVLEKLLFILLFVIILFGIISQVEQYSKILNLGFSSVVPFRFLVRPVGYLINVWATILMLALAFFGFLLLKEEKNKTIVYFAFFLCLTSLILSFSRAGCVLALLSLFVIFYFMKREERVVLSVFSIVSFIVVYLCYGEDVIRSFMLTSDVLQQNSAWGRVYAAKNAIGLFDIHPLIGNGVGSYFELINEKLFQDISGYTSFAPNVICKVLIERGVVGSLPFVACLYVLFRILFVKNVCKPYRYLILMLFLVLFKEMTLVTIENNHIAKILLCIFLGILPACFVVPFRKCTIQFFCISLLFCFFTCMFLTYTHKKDACFCSEALAAYRNKNNDLALSLLSKASLSKPVTLNKRIVLLNMNCAGNRLASIISDIEDRPSMISDYISYKEMKKSKIRRYAALVYLKRCSRVFPENVMFHYLLYKEYFERGELADAANCLSKTIMLMPSLLEENEIKYNLKVCRQFRTLFYRQINYHMCSTKNSSIDLARRGYVLFLLGRIKEAKIHLLSALKIQPNLAVPYYLLSKIYGAENNISESEKNKRIYKFLAKRNEPLRFSKKKFCSTEEVLFYCCFSQKFKRIYGVDLLTYL